MTRDEQLNWKLVGILIRQADHSLSTPINFNSFCIKSDQRRQGKVRCSPSCICWRPRQWVGKRSVGAGVLPGAPSPTYPQNLLYLIFREATFQVGLTGPIFSTWQNPRGSPRIPHCDSVGLLFPTFDSRSVPWDFWHGQRPQKSLVSLINTKELFKNCYYLHALKFILLNVLLWALRPTAV